MTHLTIDAARDLVRAALTASRVSEPNAAIVAEALIRAEIDGQKGHGLSRTPSYCGQSRVGKVDGFAVPTLEEARPAAVRIDAGHGFAYPAFDLAIAAVAERARSHGIAIAAIRRSHHFGVAGHHCEDLANRGFAAFVYGNAPKALAPWGSSTPVLGTNPIAFAAPAAAGAPLVIDMAVTTVARGKILAAREGGEVIPEGWALDRNGAPTTDPVAALDGGTMAPIGGAKGAALALMVEVMSAALVGAAFGAEASSLFEPEGPPPDLGQTLLAVDVDAVSGGAFGARMADLAAIYDGIDGARFPGLRRIENRERSAREGFTVAPKLLATIEALARGDAGAREAT